MSEIAFKDTTLVYQGATRPSVSNLDLIINDGEFVALVGPSGSGKSTTLRMIAGLEPVTSGDITIDGKSTKGVHPSKRDIAMVFQTYALYPHMSVAENMAFGLKMAKVDEATRKERVEEVARILDLSKYLDRRPKELSGGQRQRVAMGRAIVREPAVFLMDEPLSNLDAKLRVSTRAQIVDLQKSLGTTTVYVTHDQIEAMTMADRIAVLGEGQLQQCGTPDELYSKPGNIFVAGFLGSPAMNMLAGNRESGAVNCDGLGVSTAHAPDGLPEKITLGIRPEHLAITETGSPNADFEGVVSHVENTGADAYVRISLNDNQDLIIRSHPSEVPERGENKAVIVDWGHAHWFNTETEQVVR
ncbi:sn-glycerol-3-phosphate ABC transporter ATP-binding protein UgpC [Auritidibacter sp. NML130574]|uniref:ABC transporter ATP-binding protein n=1 Tax=Auritidibacter sp. NML130574 TaxID=2170745 RepID=UPI000D731B60|nr:sn-glycerol-3-phosphate ABC transporter ATP-binding protein UgpC [Auritidibacter sp. NML130574]AXR74010.1 sn-glycerol-3-phosphate ABC transporter ATP-binding protein UgpC [Auritidibacter sp. NML130574]